MCVQILILNVCIYLCTIVMPWFMRIKNIDHLYDGIFSLREGVWAHKT